MSAFSNVSYSGPDSLSSAGPSLFRSARALLVKGLELTLSKLKDLDIGSLNDQICVDSKSGIAHLEVFQKFSLITLQDCHDPEAKLRQIVHLQKIPGIDNGFAILPIPQFNPYAIGASVSSFLGELAKNGKTVNLDGKQQVVYSDKPTVFISNAAPRDKDAGQSGAPFIFARLGYNIFYFGTNSKELSFLKEFIVGPVFGLEIKECTTYRSRFLAARVAEWAKRDFSNFSARINLDFIDDLQPGAIRCADNFGNLKLNLDKSFLKGVNDGDKFDVCYNNQKIQAVYRAKLEDGHNGELILSAGSSSGSISGESCLDLYLKGNTDGQTAASLVSRALGISYDLTQPAHLQPALPGTVLKVTPHSGRL